MAEAYYIFTDEAGAYNKRPSESFRRSHPFYIRANVRLSASDYRVFQREIQELNTKYGVPVGEEIKWSDLWEISKGKYRADFLKSFRFLYKGIIIKHNKTEPTYTKTSLFLCEKRRFFMAWFWKGVVLISN